MNVLKLKKSIYTLEDNQIDNLMSEFCGALLEGEHVNDKNENLEYGFEIESNMEAATAALTCFIRKKK